MRMLRVLCVVLVFGAGSALAGMPPLDVEPESAEETARSEKRDEDLREERAIVRPPLVTIRQTPDRLQVPFGRVVPRVRAQFGVVTTVMLEPGEELLSHRLGDSAHWDFEAGVGERGRPYFSLRPFYRDTQTKLEYLFGMETNLHVITDRRVYQFILQIISPKDARPPTTLVEFDYPQDDWAIDYKAYSAPAARVVVAEPVAAIPAVEQKSLMALTPQTLLSNASRYGIKANRRGKAVEPTMATDDGERMYLVFNRNISRADLPAVVAKTSSGKSAIPNFHVEGRAIVVHEVYSELQLVSGTGRRRGVVTVTKGTP